MKVENLPVSFTSQDRKNLVNSTQANDLVELARISCILRKLTSSLKEQNPFNDGITLRGFWKRS